MRSIIQDTKECYLTGRTDNLQEHHIFYGLCRRKLSEKYGLKIWLTAELHTGCGGVHFNKALDLKIKKTAQMKAMEYYNWSIQDFIHLFGKSYL